MTYFYVYAIAIVLIAIAFVCYPIIKTKMQSSSSHRLVARLELSNANVIKQRITELESEVEEGLIDADEKENAIRDLKLALVSETPDVDAKIQKPFNPIIFILLALPAIAIGAWVYVESNQLPGLFAYKESKLQIDDLRQKLEQQGPQSLTPDDFAQFALSLRSSLRDNPDDARGWSFLAMVNTSIGRVDEGLAAYKKALDLTPQDDALRFKYAEALMLQGGEESLQNSARQLSYLIQRQPENGNNRLLLTSVAIQLQNVDLAVTQFSLIKNNMNPTSQFYQTIVAELRKLGVNDISIVGESSMPADALSMGTAVVEGVKQLFINVNISDDLVSRLPERAYLIVFAQNGDGGSRAPLAVKRVLLQNLPVQIVLSDSDAMIPAMNLSSANTVNITARVSMDEDVMPTAGELEGKLIGVSLRTNTKSDALTLDVIINNVL